MSSACETRARFALITRASLSFVTKITALSSCVWHSHSSFMVSEAQKQKEVIVTKNSKK